MGNLDHSTFSLGGILLFKSAFKTPRGVFLKLWQILPPWYITKIHDLAHNKLQSLPQRLFKRLVSATANLTMYGGTGIIRALHFTYFFFLNNLKKTQRKDIYHCSERIQ